MIGITILGCSFALGLAFKADPVTTTSLCISAIKISGLRFVVRKMLDNINKDASDIVNFAAWSIVAYFCIKILKLSFLEVESFLESISKIVGGIEKFAEVIDKITFWN